MVQITVYHLVSKNKNIFFMFANSVILILVLKAYPIVSIYFLFFIFCACKYENFQNSLLNLERNWDGEESGMKDVKWSRKKWWYI